LFLLEGSITIIIAAFAIFTIPDYPSSPASWLTPEEHLLAIRRMEEDGGNSLPMDASTGLVEALSDWRVWWLSIALMCLFAACSFSNFLPTVVATMGYSPTISLLLCAPPWIFGTMATLAVSRYVRRVCIVYQAEVYSKTRHSDLSGERFWHIFIPLMVVMTGFVLAMSTMNTAVRYLSLYESHNLRGNPWLTAFSFLMTPINIGVLIAWVSNSFPHPSSKRAVGIAIVNSVAMTGNIGAP
jgi:hypothetical protein